MNETADNSCSGGEDVCDSSGSGSHATSTNTTITTEYQMLGAAARTFDGSGDYITTKAFNFSENTSFTIEAWVKGTGVIIGDTLSGAGDNGKLGFSFAASSFPNFGIDKYGTGWTSLYSSIAIDTARWNHLAATFNGTLMQIYVNGILGGTATKAHSSYSANDKPLLIGSLRSTSFWTGSVDELRISSVVRSPEEIKANAQRATYAAYNSSVLDSGVSAPDWQKINWSEYGVMTGDGETVASTSGLVAQWNFNETSGTTANNDAEGNSCGGTPANCDGILTNFYSTASQDAAASSTWTANSRRWGAGALIFDGSNDYADAGNDASMNFERTSQFSLEAWIKPYDLSNYRTIIGKVDTASKGWWFVILSSSDPNFPKSLCLILTNTNASNDLLACSATSSIGVYDTYHVAATYSGNSDYTGIKLYINGVSQKVNYIRNSLSASITTSADTWIGRSGISGGTYPFSGVIDSVRVYAGILSPDEILSNYNAGSIDIQTRTGSSANPDDGAWEAWKPAGTETQIDSMDGPYQYNAADSGLVSYWPMDEAANDNSCNGGTYDACDAKGGSGGTAYNNAAKIVEGKFAQSRAFNGISDHIEIANESDFDFERTDAFSITAWIKTNSAAAGDLYAKMGPGTAYTGYLLRAESSGKITLYLINDNASSNRIDAQTASATVNNGKWRHIAATYDGSSAASGIKIYIDGVPAALTTSGILSASILNDIVPRIGAYATGNYFSGMIDEFRIYDIELSSTTVFRQWQEGSTDSGAVRPSTETALRYEGAAAGKIQAGIPQADNNTVGLWHLDETGTAEGTVIYDSSGYANNGTTTGTTVVNGWSSKARRFNGTSDKIEIQNSPSLQLANNFTLEAWVYRLADSPSIYERILSKSDNTVYPNNYDYWMQVHSNDDLYYCGVMKSTSADYYKYSSAAVPVGRWTHLACSMDLSNNLNLYVNGVLSNGGTTGTAGAARKSGKNLQIGRIGGEGSDWSYNFNGYIDEVRISSSTRSADEIAESFRAGRDHRLIRTISSTDLSSLSKLPFYIAADRPGTYMTLTIGESAYANYEPDAYTAGFWHLDEATGTSACLKDSSGNGNHGTPAGTTFAQGKIGKARSFNGSSDYVDVSSVSTSIAANHTRCAWIKTQQSTTGQIIDTGDATNNYGAYLAVGTGKVLVGGNIGAGWNFLYSSSLVNDGIWHYVCSVFTGGNSVLIYIDGSLDNIGTVNYQVGNYNTIIGRNHIASLQFFSGIIDEPRIDNATRTASEIRQAYEYGRRTHPITIDFSASLDSGNLIASTSDTSFTIDSTSYGAQNKGDNIYMGDKIIVKENYDGTEYLSQGAVNSVNISTGAVTVASWDASSTAPSGGFTTGATVFKWQREYMDLTGPLDDQINAVTQLQLRMTDGNEGRTIYLDDIRSLDSYLTIPTSTLNITSADSRYLQYRVIFTSSDPAVSAYLNNVTVDYLQIPDPPTAVAASDGTYADKVAITWTKPSYATGYQVFRDSVQVGGDLGDVAAYDDSGATAATITPGTATASDRTSKEYVTLSLSGETFNYTGHSYTVKAFNSSGTSTASTADTGYRGAGTITYQWQVSAADSDADYSDIASANTNPYNYASAPADGSGRHYRAVLSAEGAENATSTADRGYRDPTPIAVTDPPTSIQNTIATANGHIASIGGSAATTRGFKYGLTQADTWDIHEDGSFSTGAYSLDLTGITVDTVYYIRAYATNGQGTDYGEYIQFRTGKNISPIELKAGTEFKGVVEFR